MKFISVKILMISKADGIEFAFPPARFTSILSFSVDSERSSVVQSKMKLSILMLLPVVLSGVKCELLDESDEVTNYIKESGFRGEVHQVNTDDGYLLKVHRIVAKVKTRKSPVFLMHGLSSTCGDYILSGPRRALAFLLSDNGYDVWMGNARGNKFSMNHTNLSFEAREFWNFSWHEIGYFDLPAMIDYTLKVSKAQKTFYVGHSQGTTALMVLLSTRPDYNKKIVQAHLMAPAVFMINIPHPIVKIFKSEIGIIDEYAFLNLDAIWRLMRQMYENFCKGDDKSVCKEITFILFGENKNDWEVDVVRLWQDACNIQDQSLAT
jgi:lysosomal acid lipase/cholesteryl ester hydrolase